MSPVSSCCTVSTATLSCTACPPTTLSLSLQSLAIVTVPSGVFDNLTALRTLYLFNNSISALPSLVFHKLSSLTTVHLYANKLTFLPPCTFCNNTALLSIVLGWRDPSYPNGQLGNLLAWLPTPMLPQNGSKLQSLYIANNKLRTLNTTIFSGQKVLQSIFLYNNLLSALPLQVFDNLTALQSLSLNANTFSALLHNQFEALRSLSTLDLSTNSLRYIPACLLCRPTLALNMMSSSALPSVCSVSASVSGMNLSACFNPNLYACKPCPFCQCANATLQAIGTACERSESGSYCFGGTQYACIAGSYCPSGSSNATLCRSGTFSNTTSASNCTLCPSGTYTSTTGSQDI